MSRTTHYDAAGNVTGTDVKKGCGSGCLNVVCVVLLIGLVVGTIATVVGA